MKKKPIHRGVLSIDAAFGLAIVMVVSILGIVRYSQHMTEMEWNVEARRMEAISAAAKGYIRDNRDTLISEVSGGNPMAITTAQLIQDGYLPEGFSTTNMSAQTFIIGVARNPQAHQKLVAFVLTRDGNAIPFKGLRYIAQAIGGAGGYIQTANMAEGAYGSWKMNLTDYGLNGQAGRLATFLSSEVLGTDESENDRLYRYAIASRPELNRMHAAIDMNEHNLNNVGTVNAQTGTFTGDISARNGEFSEALTAGNDIRSTDGWVITQNNKGWMNSTHGGGWFMSDSEWVQSLNNKSISTGGQIKGGSVTSEGRLKTREYLQLEKVETEGNVCTENGLVARDASGGVMSCKDGRWSSVGLDTFQVQTLTPSVGANIFPVSTHICYPSGWLKHSNSRQGNFFVSVVNGYWRLTSHNGQRLEVTCFRYK